MRTLGTSLILATLAACYQDPATEAARGHSKTPVVDGVTLYKSHCAICHGESGRGDGPAAAFLFPKPRDFSLGKYKIRSTATGELPTDEDVMNILEQGMPGGAMPSFSHLVPDERSALVNFLKTLAVVEQEGKKVNLFDSRGNPRVITVSEESPSTPQLLQKGSELYKAQGCAKCHGNSGVGDGPSAMALRDDRGYPIPPNNFTRGLYKGGGDAKDIYLRFTTGMNGTPMPSFETSLSDEERWALAHYVKSLEKSEGVPIPRQKSGILIQARRVEHLSLNPWDSSWNTSKAVTLPLMHLWQRREAAGVLIVRVAHDGESVAILLEWEDSRVDGLMLRPQDYPDAAAVMFALTDPPGHFTMGEKGRPCNIWQWRMDRQLDVAKHWDMEEIYPAMISDDYPLADGSKVHRPVAPASSHDPIFLTGKGAQNPMSQTERMTSVEDLNAVGFGSLEAQLGEGQNVEGKGSWHSGTWRVVFIRKLLSPEEKDIQLKRDDEVSIGFAVWDGGAGDRDGQKSVTTWHLLHIRP